MADDWHLVHLGSRAAGGAALVFTEAMHVEPRGRITPTVSACGATCTVMRSRAWPPSSRRAARCRPSSSRMRPQELRSSRGRGKARAPSDGTRAAGSRRPLAHPVFAETFPVPVAMTRPTSTRWSCVCLSRAARAGGRIQGPRTPRRARLPDSRVPVAALQPPYRRYGGSLNARLRFLMDVIDGVRGEWPASLPLFVRVSATDWVEGGWQLDDTLALARELRPAGTWTRSTARAAATTRRRPSRCTPAFKYDLHRIHDDFGVLLGSGQGSSTGRVDEAVDHNIGNMDAMSKIFLREHLGQGAQHDTGIVQRLSGYAFAAAQGRRVVGDEEGAGTPPAHGGQYFSARPGRGRGWRCAGRFRRHRWERVPAIPSRPANRALQIAGVVETSTSGRPRACESWANAGRWTRVTPGPAPQSCSRRLARRWPSPAPRHWAA